MTTAEQVAMTIALICRAEKERERTAELSHGLRRVMDHTRTLLQVLQIRRDLARLQEQVRNERESEGGEEVQQLYRQAELEILMLQEDVREMLTPPAAFSQTTSE